MEERPLALEMFLHSQDDQNTAQKRLIFTSKWTTALHHGMAHTLVNTHLQSLIVQCQWKKNGPHWKCPLDTPAIIPNFQDNRRENSPKTAIFGH